MWFFAQNQRGKGIGMSSNIGGVPEDMTQGEVPSVVNLRVPKIYC
jgi:hypothetical protein